MPNAAGARALLSAQCATSSCRLPRVAKRALALPLPSYLSRPQRPSSREPAGARGFRTSSPALSRSDDADAAAEKAKSKRRDKDAKPATGDPAAPDATAAPESAPQAVEAYKETLRNQGYGSARARASRSRVDEMPPFELPAWFTAGHISLYEISNTNVLAPLSDEDYESVLSVLEARFDKAARSLKDALERTRLVGSHPSIGLEDKLQETYSAAFLQVLVLVERLAILESKAEHDEGYRESQLEQLRKASLYSELDPTRLSWWDGSLSPEAQRWLASLRIEGEGRRLFSSPLANRPESEYPVCVELLTAVRAELHASPPKAIEKDVRRPVTVLSVLNYKGPSVATQVIDDIATDLEADVVHLDAATLARLLGNHLGQNLYWSRGSISTLGFAAAEMNGRMASRTEADSDNELGMIAVAFPPRLRSFLSSRKGGGSVAGALLDGRWEELKTTQALESIINSASTLRPVSRGPVTGESRPERDLIIHIHDFVELSSLNDTIMSRLRAVVDRMWQKGRRIVIVGSSSSDASDVNKSMHWRDQLVEMGREGSHVLPFHSTTSAVTVLLEKKDNMSENLNNIVNMLQAMLGPSTSINFDAEWLFRRAMAAKDKDESLKSFLLLTQHVYDIQWVYRLASLMIGSRSPRLQIFGEDELKYAVDFMSSRDKHWTNISPGVRAPYFSPLATPKRSMGSFMSSGGPEDWSPQSSMSGGDPSTSNKEFDQHEKKLLSGLIDSKDIHTTFDDIIVPQETKDSLIGLTSLSLVRPDAFSYGVLKTERIPGCLLYGPPGTGKTLLAKAVAKESGANMLEVSAASINDMYLGQSEKNVRALFSLARKMAPMVIFLDEADALLGARHNAPGRTGHRETITQFLREWDGLSDMRAFIMVATNRPFDLDEAVLRRLPRKILVDLPLATERAGILGVMLREEQLAPDVDLKQLAVDTELYSGSDLKNLCVSAAMEAVREENRTKEAHDRIQAANAAAAPIPAAEAAAADSAASEETKPQLGKVEYVFPEKRILTRAHFDKGMREISASISEDMDSLKAIRKFDQQYGDAGRKRKGKKTIGFEVVAESRMGSEEARVRQVVIAPPLSA
ncbi:hypothetical protein B0H63DRAFT_430810 [Podospora didyma]|uniref:AAA+ ATPase domain-containing protein n=1 Tax=Podospora didyma TaxID=330526 RepID=A0AAE0NST8_9PEZI|nr:hypothetical protein B0H63DRAFT_430810 [Podospora didyma]